LKKANGTENPDSRRAALLTLESAANEARGGGPANPGHHERPEYRRVRVRQEIERLKNWARESGKLTARFPRPLRVPQWRGGEHVVSLDPVSKRFLKATKSDAHLGFGIALGDWIRGATPSEYLDRLLLQNELFLDDIRLELVVERPGDRISVVTSQSAIKGRAATPDEIDEHMASLAFEKFAQGIYYYKVRGLLLFDVHPRNVLIDSQNAAQPIDPVVQRVTKDFAEFVRENTYLVDRSF